MKDELPQSRKWHRTLFSEIGLKDIFTSLFAVLGTIVTLLPFLDLEGYAEGIVVAIDVLALLIVSLLLPAKTLKLPMIDGIVISALIAVAVLVSIG